MSEVRNSPASLADMDEIFDYIARDSLIQAERLIRSIKSKASTLAENPKIGRSRHELGKDLRSVPLGNYAIDYRPVRGGIEIVRVLHQARDVESEFDVSKQ